MKMRIQPRFWVWGIALMLVTPSSIPTVGAADLDPAAPLYWCPNRTPDQQYSATPAPDCSPVVRKEDQRKPRDSQTEAPIELQNLGKEVSRFLRDYSQFLDCCLNSRNALERVDVLEDRSSHLIRSMQESGLYNMHTNQRGWTVRELIAPLSQANADLRQLRKRLEQLAVSKARLPELGYEAAGRERRRIQQEEESIAREFRSRRPPDSARTGTEIGDTTLPNRVGTSMGGGNTPASDLPTASGAHIGSVVSPDSNQQEDLAPRRGLDVQDSDLPTRHGVNIGGGNTPASSVPDSIGFEIGTDKGPTGSSSTPTRAGPSIGDSSLNQR